MTCFELTLKDNIAHIVLNRPEKRNSMIREFWSELPDLIEDIDNNARARVIVITSTGPHFTSGIDTSLFAQLAVSKKDGNARVAFYQEVKQLQQTFTVLENARVPVLVAVQGGCIGGGLDFITACDMRYATKDAFFTLFETNLAMTADVGSRRRDLFFEKFSNECRRHRGIVVIVIVAVVVAVFAIVVVVGRFWVASITGPSLVEIHGTTFALI